MIKVLKIYKNLSDVAICDKDSQVKIYAYEETPPVDSDEEKTIKEKIEIAFKIKLE